MTVPSSTMETNSTTTNDLPKIPMTITLRKHRCGDIGHIIARHGQIYEQEFNWTTRFESLVARIMADFIDNYDETCERLWVAEDAETNTFQGTVMLVRDYGNPKAAKLRTLLVEPTARGTGLGKRLVNECLEFARQVGYEKVGLWTQSSLLSARKIYKAAAFEKISEEDHSAIGVPLTGEFWELKL